MQRRKAIKNLFDRKSFAVSLAMFRTQLLYINAVTNTIMDPLATVGIRRS